MRRMSMEEREYMLVLTKEEIGTFGNALNESLLAIRTGAVDRRVMERNFAMTADEIAKMLRELAAILNEPGDRRS